jgi:hypothetical protein
MFEAYNVEFFEHVFPWQKGFNLEKVRLELNDPVISPEISGNYSTTIEVPSRDELLDEHPSDSPPTESSDDTGQSGSDDEKTVPRRSARNWKPSDAYLREWANVASARCYVLQALAVKLIMEPDPKSRREAMASANWEAWSQAEKDELDTLMANGTWYLVDREKGQNLIDARWVYKHKLKKDGSHDRYKARLVRPVITTKRTKLITTQQPSSNNSKNKYSDNNSNLKAETYNNNKQHQSQKC